MKVKLRWQIIVLILIFLAFGLLIFYINLQKCQDCQTANNTDKNQVDINTKQIANSSSSLEKTALERNEIKNTSPASTTDPLPPANSTEEAVAENETEKQFVGKEPENAINPQTEFVRSIRLDLSSIAVPGDQNAFIGEIIDKLLFAGANTVYISPWSDGLANYNSKLAGRNKFGQNNFIENFIYQAHQKNIQVFAWFVVGKDNFPHLAHPEWFAKTISGNDYYQADEPGVDLPFASLANQSYIDYHLALLREINSFQFDGWVISEPLIGWGDVYDDYYTDFSPAIAGIFTEQNKISPLELFNEGSDNYFEDDPALYQKWTDLRAQVVTDFVAETMAAIRKNSAKPIVITLFTEPGNAGHLVSLTSLKEWLGEDVKSLIKLKPDYFEIQSLWADFEFPQPPSWTSQMIKEFKAQTGSSIGLLASVQGWQVNADDFSTAVASAMSEDVYGISTYAYHTLNDSHWQALREIWK